MEENNGWKTKFLSIDNYMISKQKEKNIIDKLYKIYFLYPEYYSVSNEYDDLVARKLVRTVHIAKNTLKSSIAAGAAVVVAQLGNLDLDMNLVGMISCLTAFGAYAFCKAEGDEFPKIDISKLEQEELIEDFCDKCDKFEEVLSEYVFTVQDYIEPGNSDKIDWLSEIKGIMSNNKEYIESQKEKGIFAENFNSESIIEIHNSIFDEEELNELLNESKNKLSKKNKVRKRD